MSPWIFLLALPNASPVLSQAADPAASRTNQHGTEHSVAASTSTLHLDRGLKLLNMGEYDAAHGELERAWRDGPYRYEQVVDLYRGLGMVRAFLGDEEGSLDAYVQLLQVAPAFRLAYTVSPRATLIFEKARQKLRNQRSARLLLRSDPVVPFDQPLHVELLRQADPGERIQWVELLYRLKGELSYQRIKLRVPPLGESLRIELPAVDSSTAVEDSQGEPGALLQLALRGYDARDWEIYRGPNENQPQELPVGFDLPTPWYRQWWLWTLVGGGSAALVTATVVAIALWPQPNQVWAAYRVLP